MADTVPTDPYENPGMATFSSPSIGTLRVPVNPPRNGLRTEISAPLQPEEDLMFSFSGGETPAFNGSVRVPVLVAVASNVAWSRELARPIGLRRDSGITLRWTPVGEQQTFVLITSMLRSGGVYRAYCLFDATAGEATLTANAFPAAAEIAETSNGTVAVGVFNARVTGLEVAGHPVRVVASFWQLAGYFRIED